MNAHTGLESALLRISLLNHWSNGDGERKLHQFIATQRVCELKHFETGSHSRSRLCVAC